MKVKFILLVLVVCAASVTGFSKNTEPKQEDKKTIKTKYDFTIFKLFSLVNHQAKSDSTKITLTKAPIRKED